MVGGHYNIAVMLLNSDCALDTRNKEGWTAVQLAHRLEQRAVFSVAIQLSRRSRAETEKREQKRRLILENTVEDDDEEEEEEEEDHTRMLTSRLHSTTQCLTTARRSVTDLESQLVTAKSLVNQLEMEVDRLSLDLKREARRRTRRPPGSHRGLPALLDRCSVCLSVPRPPLLPLQCPQGHVFCSECGAR